MVASHAEEERSEALDASFIRVDAWARSLAPGIDGPWWQAALATAAATRAAEEASKPPLPPTIANVSMLESLHEVPDETNCDLKREESPCAMSSDSELQGRAPLVTLAEQLAVTCQGSQILLARACWQWVAVHSAPRKELTWSVDHPLFGAGEEAQIAELALLGAKRRQMQEELLASHHRPPPTSDSSSTLSGGAWAERASWLFVELARVCGMEAVVIPGYWKNGSLAIGQHVEAYNHCWAGVKVNGRWRLVDCTAAAINGSGALSSPFFTPPEAFIYSYMPLEAEVRTEDGKQADTVHPTLSSWSLSNIPPLNSTLGLP